MMMSIKIAFIVPKKQKTCAAARYFLAAGQISAASHFLQAKWLSMGFFFSQLYKKASSL